MLSKEEIENSFIRIETICKKEVCLFNQPIIEGNLNQIKRYINQLESREQKLIEKLEKVKQKDEEWNALNGELAVWTFAQEILSILKGEKNE